ncbi:hypothetical protein KC19_2G289900 [Ceratodon purpureus]|uniref:Uncharacterized protein n=1 Tax=Ceratodon purpureus TaxID=3225 RepID=A0A8T0J1Z2_CERPU|nr:hypothetical protein KC19_2G289900 [Ceratodon purpureus]
MRKCLELKSSDLVVHPFPHGAGAMVEAMEALGAVYANGHFRVKTSFFSTRLQQLLGSNPTAVCACTHREVQSCPLCLIP